jgi:hypothetical protein
MRKEKIRVYEVRDEWIDGMGASYLIFRNYAEVIEHLQEYFTEAEKGERVVIKIREMTQDQFDSLPEID